MLKVLTRSFVNRLLADPAGAGDRSGDPEDGSRRRCSCRSDRRHSERMGEAAEGSLPAAGGGRAIFARTSFKAVIAYRSRADLQDLRLWSGIPAFRILLDGLNHGRGSLMRVSSGLF